MKNSFKSRKIINLCMLLFFFAILQSKADQTFYDLNTIQKIEISFIQTDWDYQLDTAKNGSDGYIMAQWVKINGTEFDSVGVKFKGNSSYDSTYKKNPFNIALDQYKSQNYQGIKTVKLANCFDDPSMIREVLSYNIAKNYMDCPRANFAQVYINDNYIGLYSNTETINKQFCSDHFSTSSNTFISCSPIIAPGPNVKSNLKYIPNADSSAYYNYYEIKSKYGWNDLVALCDSVTNHQENISKILDIDRLIWMLAFDNVLLNIDSYIGVFTQNYYLYKDNTGRYNPIIWDMNMSFGGFPYMGNSNTSMGSLSLTDLPKLPLTIHATDVYWPLINIIMKNDSYKKMFFAHAKTITNDWFANKTYLNLAVQLQNQIVIAVTDDPNKFFTFDQFTEGLTTDINVGSYEVPGISNLMDTRVSYLQATAEFKAVAPTIASVTSDKTKPSLKSTVNITATITNSNVNSVWLNVRPDKNTIFTKIQMFDDGTHNDGAANDNVYGASFTMAAMTEQYYIYAENDNAGMFSPEKAEHEFYTLEAQSPTAEPGQVVINEILAKNNAGQTNELGKYEDWIELYNTTSSELNLYGLYLSDDYTNPTKFAFPEGAVIKAKSYLAIWADEGETTATYIHCNFKLSASGEQVMLSNVSGTVLDSVTFGAQTNDVSVGRCPDGTGTFASLTNPTFGAKNNCTTGVEDDNVISSNCSIYPNPANDYIIIQPSEGFKPSEGSNIKICNTYGEVLMQVEQTPPSVQRIDISKLVPGIYFIKIGNRVEKFVKV